MKFGRKRKDEDWADYASRKLGRKVERDPINGNLLLTRSELHKITAAPVWPLIIAPIAGFACAVLIVWLLS